MIIIIIIMIIIPYNTVRKTNKHDVFVENA